MTVELEAVIAALKAYREKVRGTPLKVMAVDRCIAIVKRLGKGRWVSGKRKARCLRALVVLGIWGYVVYAVSCVS